MPGRIRTARRRWAVAWALLPFASACGNGSPPAGLDDSVDIDRSVLALVALDDTAHLSATTSGGGAVQWTSRDGGVAEVTASGVVTATGVGSTWIVAAAGSARDSVAVTVTQVPVALLAASGDGQEGVVGEPLPQPVVVQVTDANGHPVALEGIAVAFEASEGGAPGDAAVVTDDHGRASTTWTLGERATADGGEHVLDAVAAGLLALDLTAVAVAGPATAMELHDGEEQYGYPGDPLPMALAVRTIDTFGNGVSDVAVDFTVLSGGGTPSGSPAMSGDDGVARADWVLGAGDLPDAGYRVDSLRASADGLDGSPVTFHAETVREPGGYASILHFGYLAYLGDFGGGGFDPIPENNHVEVDGVETAVESVVADETAPFSGLVSKGTITFLVPCPPAGTPIGITTVEISITVRGRTAITNHTAALEEDDVCTG